MAALSGSVGDIYALPMVHHAQIAADDTSGTTYKVPFSGKIVAALGTVEAISGTTSPSACALVVKEGSTTIATLTAVTGSAIVSGGGLDTTLDYAVTGGSTVLELEVDITGVASSRVDGINVTLWIART